MTESRNDAIAERLGPSFVLFLIWTFVVIARPQDYLAFLMPLRPVLVVTILTLIVMVFERTGLPKGIFKLTEVRLVLLFYLIMIAGVPFAIHRGVASHFVFVTLPSTLIFFFVAIAQLRSLKRMTTAAWIVALSILFSSCAYAIEVGRYQGFRAAAGQTYDPNDIAMVFTTYIPICLYVLLGRFGRLRKTVSAIAVCVAVAGVMLSRSRGGVLAIGVVILGLLLNSAPQLRKSVKIATVVVLAFIFLNFFSAVDKRFENIGNDYNFSEENGRINIWKQNMVILAENPIFGEGAECSAIGLGLYRAKTGGVQAWSPTHSSLIQVAVETGIVGFIVFAALSILAVLKLRKVRGDWSNPLSSLAFFVELSFYGFWASGLFLSHAYSINLFVLLAITAAIRHLDALNPGSREPEGLLQERPDPRMRTV